MPSGRPSKRRKRGGDPSTPRSTPRTSLPNLPLELLAEILLQTRSPPTVLAVSRACTFLYRTLVQNPAAAFIWRDVRLSFGSHDLDDFGPKWKTKTLNEAQCVARMFSFERCEVCRRPTRGPYVSFAVRITLCQSWHCRRKFLREFLIDLNRETAPEERERASVWVPHVESTACFRGPFTADREFYPYVHIYHKYVRKSDWEKFRHDFVAYEAAEKLHELAGGADVSSEEEEENERLMERCHAAIDRFFSIMEISAELHKWRVDYELIRRSVTVDNRAWTKKLAKTEGWDLRDLMSTHAYSSLQNCKNFSLERLTESDVRFIRSDIESELLTIRARHRRQTSEAAYKEKLMDLKTIYERMRAGTWEDVSDANTKKSLAVPPWDTFCTLPSVRLLKGGPDPNAVVPTSSSPKSSSLATSLIVADLHTWRAPVEAYLMGLLGYPNGWQSASSRMLPPLERVTARFFCRRCGEGKVGKAYQRELCLDFKGVCAHVCKATANKKKKLDWKVDMFEKDEKAIRIIKMILQLGELSEESPSTSAASLLSRGNDSIRCRTCQGWILMDFETAIGHAHRHEAMEIDLFVAPGHANRLDLGRVVTVEVKPSAAEGISERGGFERGTTELLLGRTARARNLRSKVNYICRRCPGARTMNFNGLRSHVKEKHGIRDIGDEDYVCRTAFGSD